MQHIIVEVQDQEKAQLLYEVLKALDFVTLVSTDDSQTEMTSHHEEASTYSEEFFSYAGLWADREISLTSIRQQAWPRQNQ